MTHFHAKALVPGEASGPAVVLVEPLSLWGGLDPATGQVIDQRHPSFGANLAGRVVMMPAGRGSSSASSILLEAVKSGHAPAAFVLREVDAIIALGAVVAREVYGQAPPVVVLPPADFDALAQAAAPGYVLYIEPDGRVRLEPPLDEHPGGEPGQN